MLAQHIIPPVVPGSPEHRQLITASKVAAIRGVSHYQTPAALWHYMNNNVPPQDSNPAMRRGHALEPVIRDWFFNELHPDWTKLHDEITIGRPDLPWAAANPDSVALDHDDTLTFVQIKSVARDDRGEWGKPGTTQIPKHVQVQVQWEMHMTHNFGGARVVSCMVVKYGPNIDQYDEYPIAYDSRLAMDMQQQAHQFWQSLTDPEGCPPPTGGPGDYDTFRQIHPDIEPDMKWEVSPAAAVDYIAGKEMQVQGKQLEDRGKSLMLKAMGNARIATVGGLHVARRQPTRKGVAVYPAYTDHAANTILGRAEETAA